MEGPAGDAEAAGGLALVAAGGGKRPDDRLPLHLFEGRGLGAGGGALRNRRPVARHGNRGSLIPPGGSHSGGIERRRRKGLWHGGVRIFPAESRSSRAGDILQNGGRRGGR